MPMEAIFWFSLVVVVICWLARLLKGDVLNWLTFMVLGIDLPLVLFLQDWSEWIYKPISSDFYFVFVMLHAVLIVTFIIENLPGSGSYQLDTSPFAFTLRRGRVPIGLLNLAAAAVYIIENRICTGEWFPASQGLQEHVFHASGLVYVTNSHYFLLVADALFYFATRKWRYLVYAAGLVMMPMVTRAARLDSAVEIVGLATFVGYFLICSRKRTGRRSIKVATRATLAVAAALGLVSFMVETGANRMNHFGKYSFLYSDYLGYTGPFTFGEVGAWYYGYFPMSFNNLNYNMALNPNPEGYWYGLNSFRTLYYGFFHFSWFGVPTDIANSNKMVLNPAIAVATGFWDFWYDYGALCFIPMVVSAVVYLITKRRLTTPRKTLGAAAVFFYWVSLWGFMSFQNSVYFDMVFSNMLLTYLTVWYYFASTKPAEGRVSHHSSRWTPVTSRVKGS